MYLTQDRPGNGEMSAISIYLWRLFRFQVKYRQKFNEISLPENQWCQQNSNICVGCLNDDHCSLNQQCVNGNCETCRGWSDCSVTYK